MPSPAVFAVLALTTLRLASGWSFSLGTNPPSECTPFNVTFAGGIPPYEFTFLRLPSTDGTQSPDDWGAGHALITNSTTSPLSWILPWQAGDNVVIVGSDSTGFGTGGTSNILVVGPSSLADTGTCLEDSTNTTYVHHLSSWEPDLVQCGLMSAVFEDVENPVTVATVIPGGQSFEHDTSSLGGGGGSEQTKDGIQLSWYLAAPAGSNVVFFAKDAYGPLFVSPPSLVQPGSAACSAGATATSFPFGTGTLPIPSSTAGSGQGGSTSNGTSEGARVGAIVGGVVGGIAFLVGCAALVMFLLRRYNRRQMLLRRQTYGIAAFGPSRMNPPSTPSLEQETEGGVKLKEMRGSGQKRGP